MSSNTARQQNIRVYQQEHMRNPYNCVPLWRWHAVNTKGKVWSTRSKSTKCGATIMKSTAASKGKSMIVDVSKRNGGEESRL